MSYINAGTFADDTFAASIIPPWPASMVVGNTVVAVIVIHDMTNISPPSGWDTTFVAVQDGGYSAAVYSRRIDGSESGAGPTFTVDTGVGDIFAVAYQFSNLISLNPIGASSTHVDIGNPHFGNGITTTAANSYVLAFDGAFDDVALDTPSGWTPLDSQGDSVNLLSHATLFGKTVPSSGTYSGDISENGASAAYVLLEVELLAAASPPPSGSQPQIFIAT